MLGFNPLNSSPLNALETLESQPIGRGSYTANILAEMAKNDDVLPYSFLRFNFLNGEFFAGPFALTIANWFAGSREIRGLIIDFGRIDDVVRSRQQRGPILAGDLTIAVHIPGGRDGKDTLWTRIIDSDETPETTEVNFYNWWRDLDAANDPPVEFWRGFIKSYRWTDEQILSIILGDDSERKNPFIGETLTKEKFTNIDPDDVGLIANEIYGIVEKVPIHGIDAGPNSTLAFEIDDVAVIVTISDPPSDVPFLSAGTIQIGNEQMSYTAFSEVIITAVTYGQFTGITRGVNSTTAVLHPEAVAVFQFQSSYQFLVAGHPIKRVDKLFIKKPTGEEFQVPLDRWGDTPNWTGGPGGIPRSKIDIDAPIASQFPLVLVDTIDTNDQIGVSDDIAFTGATEVTNQNGSNLTVSHASPNQEKDSHVFGSPGTNPVAYAYSMTVVSSGAVNAGAQIYAEHSGERVVISEYTSDGQWLVNGAFTITQVSNTLRVGTQNFTLFNGSTGIFFVRRNVTVDATLVKSGSANKSGTVFKIGTVTGNSAADIALGGTLLANVEGYEDNAQGDFTGTPFATIQQSRHVLKHFLNKWKNILISDFIESQGLAELMGTTYEFNVTLTRDGPCRASECAAKMAFEMRCWLKFKLGQANLIFRENFFGIEHQVATDTLAFLSGDRFSVDINQLPIDDVINKIELRYNRKWTQPKSLEAYQDTISDEDPTSIAKYGERQVPMLFQFDFVNQVSHAQATLDFYLGYFKRRREVALIKTRLHHLNLSFGSRVMVHDRMLPVGVGEIISADYQAGSAQAQRMPANDFLILLIEEADTMFRILDKIADYTVKTPADNRTIFSNLASTGLVVFTLPPAIRGQNYIFFVHDAQEIRVDPDGTELFTLTFTSGIATDKTAPTDQGAGKYLSSSTVGSILWVWCNTDGKWFVSLSYGTWTIEP